MHSKFFQSNDREDTQITVKEDKLIKVLYYDISNFPQFVGFSVVNEAEVDVSLEFPCFFQDPTNVGNLISGSPTSLKLSLYIWRFSVHILLKHCLKDFEHNFAST